MINLHLHTNKSLDGRFDINQVIDLCEKENINYISITDHDTCDAYSDIKNYNNVKIIPGIEADALIGKETYDILCYGFDIDRINDWSKKQYTSIEERQTKIFNALKEICFKKNISLNENVPYSPKDEYAHAAIYRMLDDSFKEEYNLTKVGDLYRESTINEEFPLYLDMSIVWPRIEDLRDIIHEAGGLIFLAHPYRYGEKDVDELLNLALPFIDGIEVYNENTLEEVNHLYKFSKDNNLLVSCGSDFHGNERHNDIKVNLDEKIQEEIIYWVNKYILK